MNNPPMNKHEVPAEALNFIERFLNQELYCWKLAYQVIENEPYEAALMAFVDEFYAFEAVPSVCRPRRLPADWLIEAQEYLAETIKRPLFKIEQYQQDGGDVFMAYTGSNYLGSDSYFEALVFQKLAEEYKITGIFHSDPLGGIDFFDGTPFSYSRAKLFAIQKFQAPSNEADLMDYELEPV